MSALFPLHDCETSIHLNGDLTSALADALEANRIMRDAATKRGAALEEAVSKERKAWWKHTGDWTDEEVGSVIDRIAAALDRVPR